MLKNTAGQVLIVYAYSAVDDSPVTGDAPNITATFSKDGGSFSASDDTNPTEIGGGFYAFTPTQDESNCDAFASNPVSSTSEVVVIPLPGFVIYTRADVSSDVTAILADTNELQTNQGDWATATGFATSAALATVDSNVDSILADTNELQTNQGDWATATGFSTHDASAVVTALGTGTTLTACATATGFATTAALSTVDSNVDAIKAVTDLIPDSGAMTSIATAAALTTVDGIVDDIKAVTVKLDTGLEDDGSSGYQWTTLALVNGPSGSSSVSVSPIVSQVEDRIVTSRIEAFVGETRTHQIALVDADGDAINPTGYTLVFVLEDKDGTDITTVADGAMSKTSTVVSVPVADTYHTEEIDYKWAIRETTNNEPLGYGTYQVKYVPDSDS